MIPSRLIAGTEIRVSCLGFGTASLHHRLMGSQRRRLLDIAADHGITHFDTAPSYGLGLAEQDLKGLLKGRRADFTVTTKVGIFPMARQARNGAALWTRKLLGRVRPSLMGVEQDWGLSRLRASFENSLRTLGTDYVDFLMLHEPNWESREGLHDWLFAEREAGRLRAWGIAGPADVVRPFVVTDDPLAQVVQVRDNLHSREADFLADVSRPFQFTYGYFTGSPVDDGATRLGDALRRNTTGCVLFSTRKPARIADLCRALTDGCR